jgi:hypothetical protein
MKNSVCLLGSLVVLLASSTAYSQDKVADDPPATISTDRPSFSAGSSTVPVARLQLEGGIGFQYLPGVLGDDGGYGVGSAPNLLARVGVVDFAELRLGVPSLSLPFGLDGAEASFGQVSAGAKVGAEVADSLSLGVLGSVGLAVDEGSNSGAVFAIADVGVNDWLSLTANAGVTRYEGGFTEYAASALAAFGLSDEVGTYIEWYITSGVVDPNHFADAGVTYLLAPSLQLDGYLGAQVAGGESYFGGVGVSKLF